MLLLCVLVSATSRAEERSLPLTAAYVYYFTKFVEWPDKPSVKRICIASDNPVLNAEFTKIALKSGGTIEVFFDVTGRFAAVTEAVKSANNRGNSNDMALNDIALNDIALSDIASKDKDIASKDKEIASHHCQLMYLTSAFNAQNFPLLMGKGTLLVVEQNMDYPDAAVTLVLENNKLSFDINRRNAKQQGLDISAKLLGLAREVKD